MLTVIQILLKFEVFEIVFLDNWPYSMCCPFGFKQTLVIGYLYQKYCA